MNMNKSIKIIFCFFIAILILLGSISVSNALEDYPNTHTNTGDYRRDIVEIAKTQLGYREGDNNDTKYGTWYGLPNQPWCAMFVSWCARQANIPTSILRNCAIAAPYGGYFGIPYYDGAEYTPQSGDLFFTKTFSHVGLVYYIDGDYFYTLEGNTNDTGGPIGIGVFMNRRLISDYYFGVPDYYGEDNSDHICDRAVATYDEVMHPHFTCYECSVCGKVTPDYSSYTYDITCIECNPTANSVLLGDADLSGSVDIKDVTAIQKYIAGIISLSDRGLSLGDTDQSTDITIKDATAIQKYLAGMDTGYPIGSPLK